MQDVEKEKLSVELPENAFRELKEGEKLLVKKAVAKQSGQNRMGPPPM